MMYFIYSYSFILIPHDLLDPHWFNQWDDFDVISIGPRIFIIATDIFVICIINGCYALKFIVIVSNIWETHQETIH